MTIKKANKIIAAWHRTHKPIQGGLFALAVARVSDGEVCGVAIIGRPCRKLDNGKVAEATIVATDGTRNACSKLYAMARRITGIMGYEEFTTLTLPSEGGASLRGAGLFDPLLCGGGDWNVPSRPRKDKGVSKEKKHRYTAKL